MSPRTPKQFEEIREERKTLIMDVALEHFANEGYHATTINHIAKYAGISKGLMYNYFESKEALLTSIINRSVLDIYEDFDTDRDGYLSEKEFEFFVLRVSQMLKNNKAFWRLFFQLLMQNEVREQFLKSFLGSGSLFQPEGKSTEGMFLSNIVRTITEYFIRKKEYKGEDYDPLLELNMFIISLKGFAITYIYLDNENDQYYTKTINRIIELYK
jgi:AcrR family transcriptional regulator